MGFWGNPIGLMADSNGSSIAPNIDPVARDCALVCGAESWDPYFIKTLAAQAPVRSGLLWDNVFHLAYFFLWICNDSLMWAFRNLPLILQRISDDRRLDVRFGLIIAAGFAHRSRH